MFLPTAAGLLSTNVDDIQVGRALDVNTPKSADFQFSNNIKNQPPSVFLRFTYSLTFVGGITKEKNTQ